MEFYKSQLSDRMIFKWNETKRKRNTLLKKVQPLNIKVDKDYDIAHERMT